MRRARANCIAEFFFVWFFFHTLNTNGSELKSRCPLEIKSEMKLHAQKWIKLKLSCQVAHGERQASISC